LFCSEGLAGLDWRRTDLSGTWRKLSKQSLFNVSQ